LKKALLDKNIDKSLSHYKTPKRSLHLQTQLAGYGTDFCWKSVSVKKGLAKFCAWSLVKIIEPPPLLLITKFYAYGNCS